MSEKNGSVNLEAFLAGTADGASVVDPNGVIIGWNAAAEKILGHKADDAAGNLSCSEFCTVRNHAARSEPVHHFEIKTRTRAGDPVWLDVSGVVIGTASDTPVGWILLFRDVTAAHEVESVLREKLTAPPARLRRRPTGKGTLTRREQQILSFMKEGTPTETI